jgi:hypothetical protein
MSNIECHSMVSKFTPSCRTNPTQKKKIQNTGTASKRSETSDLVDLELLIEVEVGLGSFASNDRIVDEKSTHCTNQILL